MGDRKKDEVGIGGIVKGVGEQFGRRTTGESLKIGTSLSPLCRRQIYDCIEISNELFSRNVLITDNVDVFKPLLGLIDPILRQIMPQRADDLIIVTHTNPEALQDYRRYDRIYVTLRIIGMAIAIAHRHVLARKYDDPTAFGTAITSVEIDKSIDSPASQMMGLRSGYDPTKNVFAHAHPIAGLVATQKDIHPPIQAGLDNAVNRVMMLLCFAILNENEIVISNANLFSPSFAENQLQKLNELHTFLKAKITKMPKVNLSSSTSSVPEGTNTLIKFTQLIEVIIQHAKDITTEQIHEDLDGNTWVSIQSEFALELLNLNSTTHPLIPSVILAELNGTMKVRPDGLTIKATYSHPLGIQDVGDITTLMNRIGDRSVRDVIDNALGRIGEMMIGDLSNPCDGSPRSSQSSQEPSQEPSHNIKTLDPIESPHDRQLVAENNSAKSRLNKLMRLRKPQQTDPYEKSGGGSKSKRKRSKTRSKTTRRKRSKSKTRK